MSRKGSSAASADERSIGPFPRMGSGPFFFCAKKKTARSCGRGGVFRVAEVRQGGAGVGYRSDRRGRVSGTAAWFVVRRVPERVSVGWLAA